MRAPANAHRLMPRFDWRAGSALVLFGAIALALGTGSAVRSGAYAQQVPTPAVIFTTAPGPANPSAIITIPSTPVPSLTPLPVTPTATPAPRRGRRRGAPAATPSPGETATPGPTATPTSPAFSTLDGNWEVQVQRIDTTLYSRFAVKQDGTTVSGTWYVDGQQVPFDGTYDGRLFHFVAKDPKKGNVDLSGYIENSTDMIGIVDNGKGDVPFQNPLAFTAEHRGGKVPYPKKKG